jgi:DNA-binding response OmpR family regulator
VTAPVAGSVALVQILIATDADWIVDDITAALGADDVTFIVCREGRVVSDTVAEHEPDLVIADLQIGSMGGMAVTMALRLDESAGAVPHVPVLMLLDRAADVHLARRSGAEGWTIKPINPLILRRATNALLAGERYTEGVPVGAPPVADDEPSVVLPDDAESDGDAAADGDGNPAEEEPVAAG